MSSYYKYFLVSLLMLSPTWLMAQAPISLTANPPISPYQLYQTYGDHNPKWDSDVEKGLEQFEAKSLQNGGVNLQKALNKGCQDGLLYAHLSLFYESIQNLAKARYFGELAVTKLAEQYPNTSFQRNSYQNMGRIYFKLNELDQSIQSFLLAEEKEQIDFNSFFLLAQAFRIKSDPVRALVYFEKAAMMATSADQVLLAPLYTEMGKTAYDIKNYEKSRAYWKKVIELKGPDKLASHYLTILEKILGAEDKAEETKEERSI